MAKAIVTTSDINVVGPEGKDSWSTGVLEEILRDGHEVYLVTTRSKLGPTDDWWVKLIDSSKIFMGEGLNFQKGWHDLFKTLDHPWPTEEDIWSKEDPSGFKEVLIREKRGYYIEGFMESPTFWTRAKDLLKRNESYIWGEDVKRSLRNRS